jgi:hypothetical protein
MEAVPILMVLKAGIRKAEYLPYIHTFIPCVLSLLFTFGIPKVKMKSRNAG